MTIKQARAELRDAREARDPSAYAAQIIWSRKIARLCANPTALEVPPAPDYSTHEAVTQRALEGGTRQALDIYAALKSDGRVYRQLRLAIDRR